MYKWRKLSQEEREDIVQYRKLRKVPWHAPPHWNYTGRKQFLITATCYEHAPVIGFSSARMADFEMRLLEACQKVGAKVYSWCVLPNHYHILVLTDSIDELRSELGLLLGRTSFEWNGEEDTRGRKVWFRSLERPMKSERHFWTTMNYVHNNPVKHGYVKRWQDWPYSSARQFIEEVGRDEAIRIWEEYPLLDYGKKWDHD
ncbi:MAG: hypothetical protein HKN33_11745 [Pyrinomonadaceae bacterium]|nr:hypothetical protein [Pyrinomonadaceae bacterium]